VEALKNWLLLASLLVFVVFGLQLRKQAQTIAALQARAEPPAIAGPPPPPAAAEVAMAVQTAAPGERVPAEGAELQAMSEERDRFRVGLEKCVVALNATVAASERRAVTAFVLPAAAPAPRPAAAGAADIVPLSDEVWVYPQGDSMLVEGKVYNRGTARGTATVTVTLNRNGRPYATEQMKVEVAAGAIVKWSHRFRGGGEAAWTATAAVEAEG